MEIFTANFQPDWQNLSKQFIENLGLEQNPATTQIEPHDSLVKFFQSMLISILFHRDCVDILEHISLDYFIKLKKKT